MHARYYDTQLHRFISADPNPVSTDNALNFNRYAYASNSPYRFYDPSGRDDEDTNPPDNTDDSSGCASEAPELCPGSGIISTEMHGIQQNIGTGVAVVDKVATTATDLAIAAIPIAGEVKEAEVGIEIFSDVRAATTATDGAAAATDAVQEAARLHHSWPKYLGGEAEQDLVSLSKSMHDAYHSGLDKILPRQWGTPYYESLGQEAKQQVLSDLAAYTKAFDAKNGTQLYNAMLKNGFPNP
ncbi:MAG: RHS repeat-associated core domain-containing protein [Dokdonella sp.]